MATTKTINIAGKQVQIAYCYATEVIFSDFTGMDFATYLGGGISSVLYGILIDSFGYVPMFASWAAVSLISLLIFARVRQNS